MSLETSFVFVVDEGLPGLFGAFRSLLSDRWVASYQVGFGPPLVRATAALAEDAGRARSALDKLDVYLRHALLDEPTCQGLARRHREALVRRRGPVEAEALDDASEHVWDLSLRLHTPATAPRAVAARMHTFGVTSLSLPPSTPPEALTGRFRVHLHDPRGGRLLDVPAVSASASTPGRAAAVELRVGLPLRWVWQRWLVDLEARDPSLRVVDLGEPTSHARVRRDGVSR